MLLTSASARVHVMQDVLSDLRVANPTVRSPHKREVVLPDGVHNLRGYVKPPTADLLAAFKEGGKNSGIKSGTPHTSQQTHMQKGFGGVDED